MAPFPRIMNTKTWISRSPKKDPWIQKKWVSRNHKMTARRQGVNGLLAPNLCSLKSHVCTSLHEPPWARKTVATVVKTTRGKKRWQRYGKLVLAWWENMGMCGKLEWKNMWWYFNTWTEWWCVASTGMWGSRNCRRCSVIFVQYWYSDDITKKKRNSTW